MTNIKLLIKTEKPVQHTLNKKSGIYINTYTLYKNISGMNYFLAWVLLKMNCVL